MYGIVSESDTEGNKKGDCAITILTVTAQSNGVMKEQITKRLVKP